MTVREAFEKLAPFPDGEFTCHMGYWGPWEGIKLWPTIFNMETTYCYIGDRWAEFPHIKSSRLCPKRDISNEPADAYLGFMGEEYDRVVRDNA